MSDDTGQCGEIQGNGQACDNPVKYADGKCGIHSDVNGDTQGRPTKFNNERARIAIESARGGKSVEGCERAAGVARGTIENWLDKGHTYETEDGLTGSFFEGFAQARAQGESQCIRNGRSEHGDASFEKFLLASSFGYKKTDKTELTGEDGGPVEVSFNEEVVGTPWSDGGDTNGQE